jgi:2-dehydro-3-deoxygluconokinase
MATVASIGECMVELSPRPGGLYGLGFGGDTLNTAVYLARLGVGVDYLTALGDDGFSTRMLAAWQAEGVGTALVPRLAGRLPGLYLIERDESGERRFHYWRDRAPARELFAVPQSEAILAALPGYGLIYFSGISLSLYGEAGRQRLLDGLDRARAGGVRIAFDTNYRPRGWAGAEAARAAMNAALARVDIALCSLDDERAVHGDADAAAAAGRLHAAGVGEVVIKLGAEGALIAPGEGAARTVPAIRLDQPVVDTTAAGDSFNAAYLAARLAGRDPADAARAGHRLAAEVVRHPGAIIPREAMPPDLAAEKEESHA